MASQNESGSGSTLTNLSNQDPARKYGQQDPINRTNFSCSFCNKVVKGGVFRLKQHLVGGFSNVVKCKLCPENVREEIRAYMIKKTETKEATQMIHTNQVENLDGEDEDDCGEINLSSKRSSGNKRPRQKGPIDVFFTPNPQDVLKSKKGGKQQTINEVCRKDLRDKTCRDIARWFYDAGIPFHAANYDSFKVMIESIGQFGPGMKPPSMYEIRVPLLKKEVDDTLLLMNDHKKEWCQKGCSIMSDGWRDSVAQKDIINFLVNSPKGSVFIKSLDVSEIVKDAMLLFHMLDDIVEEVGEENVVQVITDNASNYVKAGKMLESKRPHLYWTPCAAHCIDLMLEDIGEKIPKVKMTLKKAMFINGYIYNNHIGVVNMMRRYTNQRNLHRPAITRFATSFITLSQMHKQKHNLRKMITSQEWTTSKWAKESGGKKITQYILQESFWRGVLYALKITSPLVKVLRIVDGEKKPPMGYIYEAMDRAKEAIVKSFENKEENYKKVFEMIDNRWECQMHRPLHAAGHFLNPEIFYDTPNLAGCTEVCEGLYKCIERLIPDIDIQDKIGEELSHYQNATGLFGLPMAIRQRKKRSPGK